MYTKCLQVRCNLQQTIKQQKVVPAKGPDTLRKVAELRANAYYEDQSYNRFKQSFIKQFAEKEFTRLSRAVDSSVSSSNNNTNTVTLVSTSADDPHEHCTGTLDILYGVSALQKLSPEIHSRNGSSSNLIHTQLENDQQASSSNNAASSIGYVLNVVVAEELRHQGIGKQLMAAAKEYSAKELGCRVLYAHVDAVNEVATGLYVRSGFQILKDGDDDVKSSSGTIVGKQLLLRCEI